MYDGVFSDDGLHQALSIIPVKAVFTDKFFIAVTFQLSTADDGKFARLDSINNVLGISTELPTVSERVFRG